MHAGKNAFFNDRASRGAGGLLAQRVHVPTFGTIYGKTVTNRTFLVFELIKTVITVVDTGRYCF